VVQPKTINDLLKDELAVRGNWAVACLTPQIAWPTSVHKVMFRGHMIFLLPQVQDYFPAVAVMIQGGLRNFAEAQKLLMSFLSALSWMKEGGIVISHWTGGSLPAPMAGFGRAFSCSTFQSRQNKRFNGPLASIGKVSRSAWVFLPIHS
jgi:hypothetical protein